MHVRRTKRRCAVPECGHPIEAGNVSGVCRRHIHSAGFCGCTLCAGRRQEEAVEEPSDRVRVRAAGHGTCSSQFADSHVTMPRTPWEVDL